VAANRDEFFARPTRGPELWFERPRVVAGRDLRAGGTWMGATDEGFLVGLTNQRGPGPFVTGGRSRGDVVLSALLAGTVGGVRAQLAQIDPSQMNPFNLLYGDAQGLEVAYAHPGAPAVRFETVTPGLHVLPNDVLDSAAFPKVARAQRLLAAPLARVRAAGGQGAEAVAAGDALFAAMTDALADTWSPPTLPEGVDAHLGHDLRRALHALCVVTPTYGTRSATTVALRPGGVAHYGYADGRPGETPWVDHTALFAATSADGRHR
jgi:uncharacterized protein with NRDE domain